MRFAGQVLAPLFHNRKATTRCSSTQRIPTSLPPDVQDAMVHSIAGLENARIVQYGYAVSTTGCRPTNRPS
jgi:tRNA U34 5-carboxymethylaminomethyl modifying enzyme MnmG/GidA